MELIPIRVITHSGYKADEYPKRFTWEDINFEIIEIIDRWYEGYQQEKKTRINYYRVRTQPAGTYLLRHEFDSGNWHIVI